MKEEELFGSIVGGHFHSAVCSVAPLWWHALLLLSMVVLMSIISVVGMIPLGWGRLTSVGIEFVMGWMPLSVRGGGILFTAILHVVLWTSFFQSSELDLQTLCMMVTFVLVGGTAARRSIVTLQRDSLEQWKSLSCSSNAWGHPYRHPPQLSALERCLVERLHVVQAVERM